MSRLSSHDLERLNAKQFRKQVTERVEAAIAEARTDLDAKVQAVLDRVIEDVVPAFLGLRRGWGDRDWDNGIDREHPLGSEIRDAAQQKAEAVVTDAIRDWKPSKAMVAAIRKEYEDQLQYAARDVAAAMAHGAAQEWAETFLAESMAVLGDERWMIVYTPIEGGTPGADGPFGSEDEAQSFLDRYSTSKDPEKYHVQIVQVTAPLADE